MLKPVFPLLVLVLLSTLATAETTEPGFRQLAPESVAVSLSAGDILATEWRYTDQAGQSIGLHRYRLAGNAPRSVLLYLPGTNMNGMLKTHSEEHNLWLYLAARGVVVFAMDYRTRFVPHDYEGDLSFMRDWGMDLFVEDAGRAFEMTRQAAPRLPIFISGFSRGASYAYALAGQVEAAGLIVLDGSFKQVPYVGFDMSAALKRFDDEGRVANAVSRRGYARRSDLMQRVIDNPGGAAGDPGYDTAAEHLSDVLYRAWGPGVLSNTRENVSDIQVLAQEMQSYDWFFPRIQDIEGAAIRSQPDDPSTWIDDKFGSLSLPIIYFGSGGTGAESLIAGIHSASRSGSGDVSIHVMENYGHVDILFARRASEEIFAVIDGWMKRHEAGNETSERGTDAR